MRQLKSEVVEQRKKNLLQWIIHHYIKHSRPVSSAVIAKEAGLGFSSATIRNILQELEDEGFLRQPHTSAGREPTDKGYRFYVDYLLDVQRLASGEKEAIDRGYGRRMSELDTLLSETSKLLSRISQGAGLVLSPQMRSHALKRLELIQLGGRNVLGILVTEAGLVRHWPIRLAFVPSARQINVLNRFLNEDLRGCSIRQAQAVLRAKLQQAEREFRELNLLAAELLREVGQIVGPEALYVEGTDNILARASEIGDLRAVQSLMRVLGEKRRLAGLLERELSLEGDGAKDLAKPHVRIGRESGIPELSGLSLVTRAYRHNDRVVGVLGILGSKRMEYSHMISLVNYMSEAVSRSLSSWALEERDEP